jgi:hypothetical protein
MSTRSQSAGTPHGRVAGIAESMADVSDVWVGEIRSRSVIQFATQELQIVSLGRMIRLGGSVDERTDLPHLRAPCSRSSHGYHPCRTAALRAQPVVEADDRA